MHSAHRAARSLVTAQAANAEQSPHPFSNSRGLIHPTTHSQATYDAFMRTQPTLEAFEAELRKYNALEQEIAAIPTIHNIGGPACAERLLGDAAVCGASHVLRVTGGFVWKTLLGAAM